MITDSVLSGLLLSRILSRTSTEIPFYCPLTYLPVSCSIINKVITEVTTNPVVTRRVKREEIAMETRPRRLTAAFVERVRETGRYGDGRGGFGLSLLVKPSATGRISKSWAQRLRIDGVPFNLGLGQYPRVTLTKARDKALANVRKLEDGKDPREKPVTAVTFADALERMLAVKREDWRGGKTEKIIRQTMAAHVLPAIGKRPVATIRAADLLSFLTPLATRRPALARKTRGAIGQVFQWSIAQGIRADNPANGDLAAALPKMGTKAHHRALPYSEVPAALRTIAGADAWLGTKLAFRFLALTACRSLEARAATWAEIDLEAAIWTLPGSKTKTGREHRVPLSKQAMDVLEAARSLSGGDGVIFRSQGGRQQSDTVLSGMLRDNEIEAVPHGFRSSFRDWAAENNIDRQVAEAALGHVVGGTVETAYLRSDLIEKRRDAMQAWADYVAGD